MTRLDLLRTAYGDLLTLAGSLSDADGWLPTGCLGWTVRDLVQHHLLDGQRALVALGTPAVGKADRDAVSYWSDWPAGGYDDGTNRRNVRAMAGWDDRRWALVGTGRAVPTADERSALGAAADRLPLFA